MANSSIIYRVSFMPAIMFTILAILVFIIIIIIAESEAIDTITLIKMRAKLIYFECL